MYNKENILSIKNNWSNDLIEAFNDIHNIFQYFNGHLCSKCILSLDSVVTHEKKINYIIV